MKSLDAALLAGTLSFCLGPFVPYGRSAEAIEWHGSYAAAIAEAKLTGKPLFLEFRCAP